MNPHLCIACSEDRALGSGFCALHKEAHEEPPWVKAWHKYQAQVAKVGLKNAVWSPPRKVNDANKGTPEYFFLSRHTLP